MSSLLKSRTPLGGLPLRRRDCDSIKNKNHFTVAYWSNLQFVMALLPPARPQCDDNSPWIKCSRLFIGRIAVASPQWETGRPALGIIFGSLVEKHCNGTPNIHATQINLCILQKSSSYKILVKQGKSVICGERDSYLALQSNWPVRMYPGSNQQTERDILHGSYCSAKGEYMWWVYNSVRWNRNEGTRPKRLILTANKQRRCLEENFFSAALSSRRIYWQYCSGSRRDTALLMTKTQAPGESCNHLGLRVAHDKSDCHEYLFIFLIFIYVFVVNSTTLSVFQAI
jgi:hypothetical protein